MALLIALQRDADCPVAVGMMTRGLEKEFAEVVCLQGYFQASVNHRAHRCTVQLNASAMPGCHLRARGWLRAPDCGTAWLPSGALS